ncbi:putative methyltransferase [Planctomycetes bacterium Poly30]|uniref:Putative methyltransferase n=1 Tax=Saltatorellus ferox TaxID=2528018 RepID=A0A518EX94_9BACT|nr:putative methyltransferase [Planctomycetes bacterium Poly30]
MSDQEDRTGGSRRRPGARPGGGPARGSARGGGGPARGAYGRPQKPALKLQTTTLWYYPSQQYSDQPMGLPGYEGRTPAWVIWNLLERYTREGDLVVDPFCGGGTTLDVARDQKRRALGYDLRPMREDIFKADARELPLEDQKADFVFMDPPYSTHIDYSEDPRCIGKLSAFDDGYFEAMEQTFAEADRVLRDRRYFALYVSDSFEKKKGFVPIGARLAEQLRQRFRIVDHIAVVRGNRKLEKPAFHTAAAEGNFYLRGFQHLIIAKKER